MGDNISDLHRVREGWSKGRQRGKVRVRVFEKEMEWSPICKKKKGNRAGGQSGS